MLLIGLLRSGGFVELYDSSASLVTRFNYTKQSSWHTYGIDPLTGTQTYLFPGTPGKANSPLIATYGGIVANPKPSVKGGFYPSTQTIYLSSKTSGAAIYYTLDLKEPTVNSLLYNNATPIVISTSAVIRARAFLLGMIPSDIETQTYRFFLFSLLFVTIISYILYDDNLLGISSISRRSSKNIPSSLLLAITMSMTRLQIVVKLSVF